MFGRPPPAWREIEAALDPENYLGASAEIVDRIAKKYG